MNDLLAILKRSFKNNRINSVYCNMVERETIEDGELMDSGMFSIEDLTSTTSMNETWGTSGYPSSSYTWRSSTMELMSNSTMMNFLTAMSDIADITDNQTASPLSERRSPSIKSNHTYTGPFVLMKEYEEDTNISYCTMDNYSATTPQDMFVTYEMTIYDEEDSPESESSSKCFCGSNHGCAIFVLATDEEEGEREENYPASDTFINRPWNSIDYGICCLSTTTNVADCGPSANGKKFYFKLLAKDTTNITF